VVAGGESFPFTPKDLQMLKAYTRLVARINSLRNEEEGATATEYALVLGLVAIALVVAAVALTPILNSFVADISAWMAAQNPGGPIVTP
jgi:pilus assembly protein Flp/PilA